MSTHDDNIPASTADDNRLPCILLVEDDRRLSDLVGEYLCRNGFEVAKEYRGDRAAETILSRLPDLVILDLMLPGKDGLEVCREVRDRYHGPILMLTARDEDIDQVVGLEIGADDYVTKPVQPRVLLARIRSLLRRLGRDRQEDLNNDPINYGMLHIDYASRSVQLDGEEIELTSTEFELLWLLACHAGEVLSRDNILDAMRGIQYDGMDRSVDVRVSRLRRKLGDNPNHPTRIKTVRGKGYLFVKDTWL